MNLRVRKKRNRIMMHYGFNTYVQYQTYLRFRCELQHYKERNWFSEKDREMMAYHAYPFLEPRY